MSKHLLKYILFTLDMVIPPGYMLSRGMYHKVPITIAKMMLKKRRN